MMIERIGKPAMLEQMAEEAAELAKAALKLSRIYRKENPTPVTEENAVRDLIEEYTDVCTCAKELGLHPDLSIERRKQERFLQRMNETQKVT